MDNSPTPSSTSTLLFFSESEGSIDTLLEEQDIIISDLRTELEKLKKDVRDVEDIRRDVVKCLRISNTLIEKVNK